MQAITDNLTLVLTVSFVLCVAQGMLAQAMALEKGHGKRWFWAGCLLPLVGIVWVAGLPDARLRKEVRELAQEQRKPAPVDAWSARAQTAARRDDGEDDSAALTASAGSTAFDDALVAALAASVAAMGNPGVRQTVRSVRRAAGPTAWSRAGDRRRA